ncbi:MAG: gamma carbonic anhydrase family protein [Pseudomonadota bacterium]
MAIYEFEGKRPQVHATAFVHPQAVLIGRVAIAADCFVGAGAVLRGDFGSISMGQGSNIQENAVAHTHQDGAVVLDAGVIVGHGAILHDALLGQRSFVGMNAVLLPGVVLEEGAMVAAGAVLPAGMLVPAGQIAAGNPARLGKTVSPALRQQLEEGLALYQGLPRRCLEGLRRLD